MSKEKKVTHIGARFGRTEQTALDLLTSSWRCTPSEAIRDAVLLAARAELAKVGEPTSAE
ncbi:MAG: hypothetical protein KGJ82_11250 [Nitrospirota bacterium]|nr:hypothetical protein [Nitrospirota bacterium]